MWLWGLNEGVMNLTGALDVLDAKFLDARLSEMAGLECSRKNGDVVYAAKFRGCV